MRNIWLLLFLLVSPCLSENSIDGEYVKALTVAVARFDVDSDGKSSLNDYEIGIFPGKNQVDVAFIVKRTPLKADGTGRRPLNPKARGFSYIVRKKDYKILRRVFHR